jgi:hypothetical protein
MGKELICCDVHFSLVCASAKQSRRRRKKEYKKKKEEETGKYTRD